MPSEREAHVDVARLVGHRQDALEIDIEQTWRPAAQWFSDPGPRHAPLSLHPSATGSPVRSAKSGPRPIRDLGRHRVQDLQSLLMHQETVRLIRLDASLAGNALDTLRRWRTSADPRTFGLLDEWERIIAAADWSAAVQETEHGNQLRQASPLPTLLPDQTRLAIIAAVKALKNAASRRNQERIDAAS